jgi:putative toxin-antitoxin system antitoxin component (TIGR02293 family)
MYLVMSYDEQINAINEVNESLTAYVKNIENVSRKISFADFFLDKMLIIQAIRRGLPYKIFAQIKSFTPFTDTDWADYLDLSSKTLQRYRDDNDFYFKPIHTEKIFELAEVTNFGMEVFGSSEKFYRWLNSPSFALNGYNPGELLKDSYGKEMVMAEINRIEHGIFA